MAYELRGDQLIDVSTVETIVTKEELLSRKAMLESNIAQLQSAIDKINEGLALVG